MHRFWSTLIGPILSELAPRAIVEVGVERGSNTRNLLEFARDRDCVVHCVDTQRRIPCEEWQEEFENHFRFHQMLSLNALPTIGAVDVALLDGDHNWYSVSRELELLARSAREARKPFPLVLLHDVAWPYGRRDLYHDPDTIPAAFQMPFRRQGIEPGCPELVKNGGLNAHLLHAIVENGERNGVATAVEDHIEKSRRKLRFLQVPGFHGLGILFTSKHTTSSPFLARLSNHPAEVMVDAGCVDTLESARLKAQIALQAGDHKLRQIRTDLETRNAELSKQEDELNRANAAASEAVDALAKRDAQLDQLTEQLATQTRRTGERQSELEVLRTELEGMQSDHDESSRRFQAGLSQQRVLRGVVESRDFRIKGLERELQQAAGKRRSLTEQLATGKEEVRLLSQRVEGFDRVEAELADVRRAVAEQSDQTAFLAVRSGKRERANRHLAARIKNLCNQLKAESELRRQSERHTRDQAAKIENLRTASELNDSKAAIEKQLLELKAATSDHEHQIEKLATERSRLRDECDRAVVERKRETTRCASLETERARLARRKDELISERAQLRGSISGISRENAGLRDRLGNLQGDLTRFEGWMSALAPHVTKVLESRRLRVGNAVGDVASKLVRRPILPMDGTIRGVLSEYRQWRKPGSRAPVSPATPFKAGTSPHTKMTPVVDVPIQHVKGRRKRGICYMAIAGGYDQIKDPLVVSDDFDYVCFSDDLATDSSDATLANRTWQLRKFDYHNVDPTRMARHAKLHPHVYFPDYEVSIWIDANLLLKGDLNEFLETLGDRSVATFPHPHRQCIYEEAQEIIKRGGLDKAEVIKNQLARYEREGYPRDNGLAETNVLVRRHNQPEVIALMNAWWRELDNGSKRDQLSLNYVAHCHGIEIGALAERGQSVRNDHRVERFQHGDESNYRPAIRQGLAKSSPSVQHVIANRSSQAQLEQLDRYSVDIVVCVHNSREDVERCLDSVYATLRPNHRVIVVDDGSDRDTAEFLVQYLAERPRTTRIRHERARGYTKAANAGVKNSTADYVIMLNSDTIVSPNWALKLVRCGERAPDVGIIGPLSNAASWQSIPMMLDAKGQLAINSLPEGYQPCHLDQLVELCAPALDPRVPLLNGFCFAIKRAVIEQVGLFDEVSFPDGYGEENDYCFRTTDAGFALVVATDTYVFHAKSKSYTHERRAVLSRAGSQAFRSLYSSERIGNGIESMKQNPLIGGVRERVDRVLRAVASAGTVDRRVSQLSVLFLLPSEADPSDSRSIVADVLALRPLGVDARIALPRCAEGSFRAVYREDFAELTLIFDDARDLLSKVKGFSTAVATDGTSFDRLMGLLEAWPELLPAYYAHDGASGSDLCAAAALESVSNLVILSKADALRQQIDRSTGRIVHKIHYDKDHVAASGDSLALDEQVRNAAHCSGRVTAVSQLLLLTTAVAQGTRMETHSRQQPAPPASMEKLAPAPVSPATSKPRSSQGSRATESKLKTDREVVTYDITPEILSANELVIREFRRNPVVTPKRALWFIPNFDHILRGGLRTIFATAESFTRRWGTHNIIVVYGQQPAAAGLEPVRSQIRSHFPSLDFDMIELVGEDDVGALPESDIGFSTLWTSAYLLARYNRCRGKFYFVQDYEPTFYAAGSVFGLIEQTYRFGFTAICNSAGVAEQYRRYSPWVGAFTPGVDRNIFHPTGASLPEDRPYRVVFYGRPKNPRNGFRLGVEALTRVKKYFGDRVEIISVGAEFSPDELGISGVLQNWGVLSSMQEVAALYRSADVGLVFMYSAHPSYQPIEYMASGCATVTNYNPSNGWLLRDGENAFVSESTTGCVAERIIRALEDREQRHRIIEGGLRTAASLDWNRAFREIQEFVSHPRPTADNFLEAYGAASAEQFNIAERARSGAGKRRELHGARELRGGHRFGNV